MPKRRRIATSLLILPLTTTLAFTSPHARRAATSLHGLSEWREEALSTAYTLDAYTSSANAPKVVGSVPILPFPFHDILLPGQTKQLNLYEERFHVLFDEATENHSVIGMGLLAGAGMMTLLPLLEIESVVRLGYDEDWVSNGDGMGNGSIFVTVRAVGRARIVEELEQEEPYMRARVVEVVDDGGMNGVGMVKEKSGKVEGEATEIELGSMIAGSIETLVLNLASMEHKYNEWKDEMTKKRDENRSGVIEDEYGNKISRTAVNAKLEALFSKDTIQADGINLQSENLAQSDDEDDELIEEEKDTEELNDEDEPSDRRSRYHAAFDDAKNCDTQGYVSQNIDPSNLSIRSLKDLTAISWAVFCTNDPAESTETEDIQNNVFKIQALDTTNVLQRLNLGAAMLRMEKKKLKAKLALAGKGEEENVEELDEEL